MSLEFRIEGAVELHKVAARIYAEGRTNLARQMGNALSKAADPVKVSIRAEAERTMPKHGGYSGLFTKSLKFRLERRNGVQQATAQLITYADGKGQRRDIGALNRGVLRHPVFGRRRSPWKVTSIRAGFHKRGTDHAIEEAQKQLGKVVDDFVDRLGK